MKKHLKHVLSFVLSLAMLVSLLPVNALATTTVKPSPNTGNSDVNSLEVEYFSSTLYNWDESAANAATAVADLSTDYTRTTVAYSTVASSNATNYTSTNYYYLVDGIYYPVYYTRSETGGGANRTTTYTLYYLNGSTYTQIRSTTTGSDTVTLYTSGGYEGKGFYFTASGNKGDNIPSFSSWSGSEQNYMIYSGLAASNLNESDNAPFDTDIVNAANLFATDGTNTDYTSVYTDVQVPFVYDSETGYYTLDSDTYGVYFADGEAASGATMAIADLPMGYYAYAGTNYYKCGFAPFNTPSTSTADGYEKATGGASNTTTVYPIAEGINGGMVYGFGMVTEVSFQMTDDGQIDGEDIVFEFAGDDDVWVYIDGILVLDIGGTHDAITGDINFSTGDVTLTAENYSYIGDKATGTIYDTNTMSQTNIYTALGTTLTGFAAEGTHTMTIYYMDRGQGRTNCLIKFNLPQKDSLSVTKNIASTYTDGTSIDDDTMTNLSNIDFSFTLHYVYEEYDEEAEEYKTVDSTVANASYSLYDADGNFVQTGSTDSSGQFSLKNGYQAVFNNVDLDVEGSWYVVENLSSDRWTTTSSYTATINGTTTTGTGNATSATVTLINDTYIGSELSSDSIAFTFTNNYVKGADPDVDVYDETIVLDYGLPVKVDVTANDITTMYGSAIGTNYGAEYSLTLVKDSEGAELDENKFTGTYGYAEVVDGQIVYTLTEDFCGIETVYYQYSVTVYIEANDDSDAITPVTGSAIGKLTIIPATLMYYEEDFGTAVTSEDEKTISYGMITYSNQTVKWTAVTDTENTYGTYQETGFVGTTTDSTYGTDDVYLNNLGDSLGTSMYADVTAKTETTTNDDGEEVVTTTRAGAAFEYDFTGTGTAILSRISTDSAYIQVTVSDENGEVVDQQYIDTRVVQNVADANVLYNIPVYNIDSLSYGTYHVYVYIYTAGTTVSATYDDDGKELADSTSGGSFYLDGIRVYQPMGTSEDDGAEGYSIAESAYATDGEENIAIINIRTKIVADSDDLGGDEFVTLTDVDGNITDVDTYSTIGPNEELYLTDGQTVSFYLVNWDAKSYKIYLGIKAANGTAGTVTIGSTDLEINNSTVCYYDISSYVTVESYDVSEDEDGSEMVNVGLVTITGVDELGLIALTNIKVTGVDSFNLGYSSDIETQSEDLDEDSESTVSLASLDTDTLYLLSTAVTLTTDTEEEVVFVPESIKMTCSWGRLTKKATVTVITSTDVARVTINGTDVTSKKSGKQLNWSKTYTKVTKGTTYEVIAYDADGNASETYTLTAE